MRPSQRRSFDMLDMLGPGEEILKPRILDGRVRIPMKQRASGFSTEGCNASACRTRVG